MNREWEASLCNELLFQFTNTYIWGIELLLPFNYFNLYSFILHVIDHIHIYSYGNRSRSYTLIFNFRFFLIKGCCSLLKTEISDSWICLLQITWCVTCMKHDMQTLPEHPISQFLLTLKVKCKGHNFFSNLHIFR